MQKRGPLTGKFPLTLAIIVNPKKVNANRSGGPNAKAAFASIGAKKMSADGAYNPAQGLMRATQHLMPQMIYP